MIKKKAMGLPINIVVMLIIGIIIFGLGFGLFSKIWASGNDEINKLNEQVKLGITSLECDGEEWICAPSYEIKNGEGGTFSLYVANRGDENGKFKIEFPVVSEGSGEIIKDKCGSIELNYLSDLEMNVLSGESAKIPFIVRANKVKKVPCSFVATVLLKDAETFDVVGKTSIIMKIK